MPNAVERPTMAENNCTGSWLFFAGTDRSTSRIAGYFRNVPDIFLLEAFQNMQGN